MKINEIFRILIISAIISIGAWLGVLPFLGAIFSLIIAHVNPNGYAQWISMPSIVSWTGTYIDKALTPLESIREGLYEIPVDTPPSPQILETSLITGMYFTWVLSFLGIIFLATLTIVFLNSKGDKQNVKQNTD